ncbi:MAG: type II toxin-antitoxin system RelE/ParE family toxin [Candidatus Acididesulfobacter diazotrophicus]|jgi:mRNA interferase RelE/StbE|uniref:Type II toxin-antitoxin system RelE/ParE family toxin n=1 Tax=Candidatus Acididesulfobacter diazotrophicus TaxID=2597226 RepID=A0A519BKI6_9DELT|nr:MAG: type II toxin-antitoxin system RelE/ParE family toxin [Candidatus Acididesulfobacter diazotrophicus]
MYAIEFLKTAFDELKRLDKPVQRLIKEKLAILSFNEDSLKNNIKSLNGNYKGLFRLRVGKYRIIYQKQEEKFIIIIVRIGHRKEIY